MDNNSKRDTGFGKILFAVDATPHSRAAIETVGALAHQVGADVEVLHVWNLEVHIDQGAWDVETLGEAQELVDGVAKQLAGQGVKVTTQLRSANPGRVAEAIAAAATDIDADLVALGSRGRSDFRALVMGSVGHRVIAKVDCPVLVVRPAHGADGATTKGREKIVLAVADVDEGAHAIEAATAIALAAKATVLVLHVRTLAAAEGSVWVEPADGAEAVVAEIVAKLQTAGVEASGRVAGPSSFVAADIASVADELDADLVVIGSRRLSDLAGILSNSVDHEVVHRTERPVLIAERVGPRR